MREVTFCERSTITEAWAVLRGRPAPLVHGESAALVFAVKRALPELQREPAMVFAEIPLSGPVAPFWSEQWSWESGRLRARVGHRYLSVHRFADDEHRYETFERSFVPALTPWLIVCSQIYDDPLVIPAVAEVSFGYINTFRFSEHDFDLSRVFRLTVGFELEGLDSGLEGLDVKFHYRDGVRPRTQVMVQVAARPEVGGEVLVRAKTTATIRLDDGFWKDKVRLEAELRDAKAAAKRAFFELATEDTHRQMGALYGNPD